MFSLALVTKNVDSYECVEPLFGSEMNIPLYETCLTKRDCKNTNKLIAGILPYWTDGKIHYSLCITRKTGPKTSLLLQPMEQDWKFYAVDRRTQHHIAAAQLPIAKTVNSYTCFKKSPFGKMTNSGYEHCSTDADCKDAKIPGVIPRQKLKREYPHCFRPQTVVNPPMCCNKWALYD